MGGGQGFCVLVLKSLTMGEGGVQNCPRLRDVSYGRRPNGTGEKIQNTCDVISYLSGQEARATKNSFSAAFSSMFRRKSGMPSDSASVVGLSSQYPETSSPVNVGSQQRRSIQFSRRLSREVRQHALAAVVLEEWLQELAAIAQEQSVLQKEQVQM